MTYSFRFEEEDISKISKDADDFVKEYITSGSLQRGVPICFLGDGTYVFRIYPDRDARGRPRLIKRVWLHYKIPIAGKRKVRFWKDDRVDKLFDEARQAGLENLWGKPIHQYKSREQAYMMAHFYEVPTGQKYTEMNKAYGTIIDKRSIIAIQNLIAGLDLEDMRDLFDPNNSAFCIRLSIARARSKSVVSCSIAVQKAILPPLEFKDDEGNKIEYTGLDGIYIRETDAISDEDFHKLKQAVTNEKAADKSTDKFRDKFS
jgi:hypothetical protein